MGEFVPRLFEDADMEDPRQHCAPGIADWQAVEKMAPMPSPLPLVPYHSEQLYKLGYRHHPELQVLFKVLDERKRPRFVDRAEFDALQAVKSPQADPMLMLKQFNPDLAKSLDGLSDSERVERMQAMEGSAREAVDMLMKIREMIGGDQVGGSDSE